MCVCIVVGAVVAAAAIYAAYSASESSKEATESQSKSSEAGLAYERSKDDRKIAAYNAAMKDYDLKMAKWRANRRKLLEHYGYDVGKSGESTGSTAPKETPPPEATPVPAPTPIPAVSSNLSTLTQRPATAAVPMRAPVPPSMTVTPAPRTVAPVTRRLYAEE